METLAKELGAELLARTKERTPVDTGNLERTWSISEVEKIGRVYRITVYNNTEYAAYVEYGHRTSNHKGWVPGKFMMTISAKELDTKAPAYIQRKVKAFVNEVMKNG
jgi:bacteriophage protein of unknown function (DUF646)